MALTDIKTESVEEFLARGGEIQKTFHKEHARHKAYWKGDDLTQWYKEERVEASDNALHGAQYAGDLVATWRG
mgnify:FL=1